MRWRIDFLIIFLLGIFIFFIRAGAEEYKSCSQDFDCKVDVCSQNSCVNQSYQTPECTPHNFPARECHCVNSLCDVLVGSAIPICSVENPDATYCKDEKTMIVCTGGNWVPKDCVYKCQGGGCIPGCYKNEDCGSNYIKSYCSNNELCLSTVTPVCLDSGICSSNSIQKCTPCAGLCKEGRCFGETTPTDCQSPESCPALSPAVQQTDSCKDTDGGINYYVKGSLMQGSDIVTADSCEEDKITLREESCVPNPGPNEGTMSTNIYKCPNGCENGACIKGEKQKEEVKCIFKNTKTEQKCYRSEYNWMYCSSYQGSCIVTNLEGYDREKITWKSSCGGYAYTILDSTNEQIEFDCSGATGNFCQPTLCEDGSQTQCHVDGKGYCVCSSCSAIVAKPVCGNGVCESGEWQVCEITAKTCEAGKECEISPAKCSYGCEQDCRGIEGIEAKLDEKFKLQVSQPVKIIDYKNIKIIFRDLLTSSCEASITNAEEVKQKLTGMAIAEEIPSSEGGTGISIIKCPNVGPMAQLEIINPEEMGNKILTLKTGEAKNIYDISISFLEYDFASRTGVFIVNSETSTCPENCKCDSEGYALECKSEEKCGQGKMLCPDGKCREECEITDLILEECKSGCIYENKCLPIGVRVKGLYCSIDATLTNQLKEDIECDNNFECSSNICVSGKCISEGLVQKVLNWFKRFFGSD